MRVTISSLVLFICCSASSQLPVIQLYQNATSSGVVTPQSLGNMYAYYVFTNAGTAGTLLSTWNDLIQSKPLNNDANWQKPLITTTNVYFKINQDGMSNKEPALSVTNFSAFFVIRQTDDQFNSVTVPIWAPQAASSMYLGNGVNLKSLQFNHATHNVIFTGNMNLVWCDVCLTVSNGFFFAWTNAIPAVSAISWADSGTTIQMPGAIGASATAQGAWYGGLSEFGFYTNLMFSQANVTALHKFWTNNPGNAYPISP